MFCHHLKIKSCVLYYFNTRESENFKSENIQKELCFYFNLLGKVY